MDSLHIDDLEAAINHWRGRAPAAGDAALGPELAALCAAVLAAGIATAAFSARHAASAAATRSVQEDW